MNRLGSALEKFQIFNLGVMITIVILAWNDLTKFSIATFLFLIGFTISDIINGHLIKGYEKLVDDYAKLVTMLETIVNRKK